MALATGAIHRNLKGAMGDFIFRTYNGKTVVSLRPVYKNETNTEARRKSRGNFREATYFSSSAMEIPKKKAYYQQKARQLKLPNAYTAAITDFLRRAKVVVVTRSSFAAKQGDTVVIRVSKQVFEVKQITAILYNTHGEVLTEQRLTPNSGKNFSYTFPVDYPDFAGLRITTDEPLVKQYTVEASAFRVIESPY